MAAFSAMRSLTLRIALVPAVAALVVVAASVPPSALAAPAGPSGLLQLVAGPPSVTLDRVQVAPGIAIPPRLDLGTFLVSGGGSWQVRVSRRSYADPVTAELDATRRGHPTRTRLPGLVKDFSGLPGFFHVTITGAGGTTVLDRDETFCPNSGAVPARPDAPTRSGFPAACAANPFALGAVWGMAVGWQAATGAADPDRVDLPDGAYTARVAVNQPYRTLFGVRGGSVTVPVRARTVSQGTMPTVDTGSAAAPPSDSTAIATGAPVRPVPPGAVPDSQRPDLRALPAWDLSLEQAAGRAYLTFSATLWNAGPAPMVVTGLRPPGSEEMDAYQYFQDARGNRTGYARTGSMEWDPRPGHEHWHFSDFAGYWLLDATRDRIVRSQKESFCLANTDAVDTLVPHTADDPANTDLHSSCGGQTAASITEALAVGWGDTYVQSLPGQSFDVTDLPNGSYYVQIVANPDGHIVETSRADNTSLRRIVLGGTSQARTLTVPPYQQVADG